MNDTAAKSPLGTAAAAPLTLASGGPTIQRGPQTAPSSPLPEAASDQAEPPRPEGGASPAPREAAPATSAGLSALGGLSRATLETTAMMSAQIIRRLEMRSTRFEMALTPEGLGRVDVSLEIDGDGQLAARLAFDNPAAAAELRGRADELRRQLEQAGFQIGDGALEFAERDGQGQRENAFERAASRAFAGAGRLADTEAAIPAPRWISLTLAPEGVDMKV